jgi:hypothetical protein
VRAALFSLGVVIGLIETSCHKRVHCVASVSGGSILNAALAHAQSVNGFKGVSEFEALASKLATSLAWEGVFALTFQSVLRWVWSIFVIIGRATLPVIFGGAIFIGGIKSGLQKQGFNWPDLGYDKVPWQTVGWIGLVSLVVSILLSFWLSRGFLPQARYRAVLTAIANERPLYVKNWASVKKSPTRKKSPT